MKTYARRIRPVDRIGQRFGSRVIIAYEGRFKGNYTFRCVCDCGNTYSVALSVLIQTGKCSNCHKTARAEEKRARIARASVCVCGATKSVSGRRCHKCFLKESIVKFPETLQTVADRFGVTQQAVSYLVQNRGWEGAIAFYESGGKAGRMKDIAIDRRTIRPEDVEAAKWAAQVRCTVASPCIRCGAEASGRMEAVRKVRRDGRGAVLRWDRICWKCMTQIFERNLSRIINDELAATQAAGRDE